MSNKETEEIIENEGLDAEAVDTQPEEAAEPTRKEKHALKKECDAAKAESKKLKKELEAATVKAEELNDQYLRMLAEFDNFKKRTAKESEGIYANACADVVSELLPVFDNLMRAAEYAVDEQSKQGIEMIISSFVQTLSKIGVEQIGQVGDEFDANLHNAVMHIDDESLGENVIAEVFQKGYKRGDKVIRYAVVKVAN